MGQTLSHGVYLPNEGERNCYAGLASNWQILNTAVGNIAEKAPLVHPHGNITNDGKVGTTADKPLITGTGGVIQAGSFGNQANTFCEGNDARLSDARTPVAHTHGKADITDLFNSANTWTGDNTFSNTLNVQTGYTLGTLPQAESAVALFTGRTADSNFVTNINFYQNPTRGTGLRFTIRNKWDNNGYSTTGTTRNAHFELLQSTNKTAYMQWEGYVNNGLYPLADNTYDLGSSSYKWKTLNGINPGALSLPSNSYTGSIAITEIDRTGWVYDGTVNMYSPPMDCWLSISNGGAMTVWGVNTAFGMKATDNIAIPLRQGETYTISLTHTPDFCRIYPCNGNV